MRRLNIIGCGRVGRTLARLWHERGVFEIQDLMDHTPAHAAAAARFAGAGRAVSELAATRPADLWMLTPRDAAIASCCEALARGGSLQAGSIVFHCSGATASGELAPVRDRGAFVASTHPLKSFAEPEQAAASFAGTWCGVEGDDAALAVLRPAWEAIGARLFAVDPAFKTVYHAGSVVASNYLTALMEVGIRCFARAGLPRETAMQVMEPLARTALDQVFRLGTVRALTGPVARGDYAVVARQIAAISEWDETVGEIYRRLGEVALELSREQGSATPGALERLEEVLKGTWK
ncbi:MAG: DUF2520 domain-containing protein [Betaproteobacteria bacterium]|nr:DUF2520 domain-containing protein [Betaproteobacteria bacterium]